MTICTRAGAVPNGRLGLAPDEPFDVVGVGFGPSNLALAVAAREIDPSTTCLFVERQPEFRWHPGMMLEGTRMQISFLKDLVSMRNLASPYSFLSYLRAHGRLERFTNLNEFFPSRIEYGDYLRWVADDFADLVRYGTEVVHVRPAGDLFEVTMRGIGDERETVVMARNLVVAPGGTARVPPGVDRRCAVHSSTFLPAVPERLPDRGAPYRVVVAGDGQSAGEITRYLLDHYPNAEVHLVISGYAPRPADNSRFVNEQFYSTSSRQFFACSPARRARQLADLRNANYGVIEESLLDELYETAYVDEVKGRRRLFVHPYSRLVAAEPVAGGVAAGLQDRIDGEASAVPCDLVVLATGYERRLDEAVFADVLPWAEHDGDGGLALTERCRVPLRNGLRAGLYVQGLGERSFGLGDTLLSLLPFRSAEILEDVRRRRPREVAGNGAKGLYPPRRHLEDDGEALYTVIERFRFATVVSARGADDPVVTQVPLVLDRSRGEHGVLFGHFDAANPHAELLDDRPVTVLFHGPNAFISPHVYASDQLPTWNSITVVVHGKASVLRDRERVVEGLCRTAADSEPVPLLPTLAPDDERIPPLIGGIVGFEVEIMELVGRFKLSQDRDATDRRLAALALADAAEASQRDLIQLVTGIPLDEPPCAATAVAARSTSSEV